MDRTEAWAEKTKAEKRDAFSFLGEVLGSKSLEEMTKADARQVKEVLQRMPKNRSKDPRTRGRPISEILDLPEVGGIAARTVNVYISHYQSLFGWAVANGYADANIFDGMRLKLRRADKEEQRDSFNTGQLKTLFRHVTENPDGLVKKDEHKWVTLIAMFSGAQLNEVAQLELSDIKEVSGVWRFEVTGVGEANKRIKNASSRRIVPIHDKLIDCGLLSYVSKTQKSSAQRLFPALSYDKKNGYGRNVGRWFNDSFLVKLGLRKPTLVFHSLRHSMNTQLARKNAPEQRHKAIIGHTQGSMTYDTYLKDGYLPDQLRPEIDKFEA